MANETNIQGNYNIVIQGVRGSMLRIEVNGEVREIRNELAEMKALLEELKAKNFQYAEKIYNIEHINEANFWMVPTPRIFNAVLAKELIEIIRDRPKVMTFLESLPDEDKADWECKRKSLTDALAHIESSFVWVIGNELRRLFSIWKKKDKSMEARIDWYLAHCFSTYRMSLQLVIYLFLSKLWDEKSKKGGEGIEISKKPIQDFFSTKRFLKLAELRRIYQSLIEVFQENKLEFPLKADEFGDVRVFLNPESDFNKACVELEALSSINEAKEAYGLGHCHTAEIALAGILKAFRFFTNYKMIIIKRVEYEEARHHSPRYVKDFISLEIQEEVGEKTSKEILRQLKYDDKPQFAFAVLFRNVHNSINLFPFLLDYNSLMNEDQFQLFFYECREGDSSLRYFSIENERKEDISYKATEKKLAEKEVTALEIKPEQQKNEEQINIRLDLVIKQFVDSHNTMMDSKIHFTPLPNRLQDDKMDNF